MFTNVLSVVSRRTKDRILGCLIACGIVFLAVMPQIPKVIPYEDKLGHIGLYALLMIYFGRKLTIPSAAIGLIIIGAAMEGLQYTTGYRSAEFMDVVANTFGVLLGIVYLKLRGPVNG